LLQTIISSLNYLKIRNQEYLDEKLLNQIHQRFDEIIIMNVNSQKKKIKIDENYIIRPDEMIKSVNYLNNLFNFSFEKHLEYENLILDLINKEGIQSVHHIISFINLHHKLEFKLNLIVKNKTITLKQKRFIK